MNGGLVYEIEAVWADIDQLESYLADLAEEMADAQAELQGLYGRLDSLRSEYEREEQA